MIKLFLKYQPYILIFATGFAFATWLWSFKFESMRQECTAEKTALLEQANNALISNQARNNALEQELTQIKDELAIKAQQLESVRNEAISKDGNRYNGIGVNSLQHYKKSLGYDH